MICACDAPPYREHVADGFWLRECRRCGAWVLVKRRQLLRRVGDMLHHTISRCAHPDDIVFAPWLPF